jgi:hypothetical protein
MDIDTSGLDRLFEELEDEADDAMDRLVDAIDKTWREKASQQLKSSLDQYLEGLNIERVGDNEIQASLTGFLPVAIEKGHEKFDMKPDTLGNALSKIIPLGGKSSGTPKFRTMKADSSGWIHPGFTAKSIGEQVQQEMDDIVKEVFDPIFSRRSI